MQQASEKVAAVTEAAAKTDAEVTLCTKSDCPGCYATKRALEKTGVEYDEIKTRAAPRADIAVQAPGGDPGAHHGDQRRRTLDQMQPLQTVGARVGGKESDSGATPLLCRAPP
ncbi:glutaredoxin domain-containing protein [Brachybacterium sp. UNK5269]|uniref:glutaredoxin domain-containing protein n=1 Tax=Brachybacterium sp. UNK5269 TaxID=3408576 RepID=UPI003BAFB834